MSSIPFLKRRKQMEPKIHPVYNLQFEENWVSIKDFDKYEVNHLSEIRNKQTKRILKPTKEYQVGLFTCDGRRYMRYVYQLALKSFFPQIIPPDGATVDHIDENHNNHYIGNLQWLTPIEQTKKSVRLKPRKSGPKLCKAIEQRELDGKLVAEFLSVKEAATITGFSQSQISNCATGKIASACGFIWIFKHKESQEDLDGELWATNELLKEMLREKGFSEKSVQKILISNMGRVLTNMGRKTKGKVKDLFSGKRKCCGYYVHQLVWAVWGNGIHPPNKTNGLVICHDDSIPLDEDNCRSNNINHLRLDTRSENIKESWEIGRRKKT
jgi:hypothetical protein